MIFTFYTYHRLYIVNIEQIDENFPILTAHVLKAAIRLPPLPMK